MVGESMTVMMFPLISLVFFSLYPKVFTIVLIGRDSHSRRACSSSFSFSS